MTPAPSHRKLRSSRRQMIHSAAQISVPGDGEHNAIVRDLSAEGIFLYSNFKPDVGSEIALTFSTRAGKDTVKIFTKAKVVRVQQLVAGAAPGIAARFAKRIDCELVGDTWCNPETLPKLEPVSDDVA
jgi:PilZ domain-containing protein